MNQKTTRTRNFLHWLFAAVVIISLVLLTIPSVIALKTHNERVAAKNKVWNEVSYPQGNVGTVVPDKVHAGDTVNITFEEYCNMGVDVTVLRWIDFLDKDNVPLASFGLRPITFYGSRFKGGCVYNLTQPFTVPPDLSGRPPGINKIRLRNVTTYEKPEQTVKVPSYSESFYLLEDR